MLGNAMILVGAPGPKAMSTKYVVENANHMLTTVGLTAGLGLGSRLFRPRTFVGGYK